jgi:hypothetical protein
VIVSNYYHTYKVIYQECMDCEPREEALIYQTRPGKCWVRFTTRDPEISTRVCKVKELGMKVGDSISWVCDHGQLCRAIIVGEVRWSRPHTMAKEREAMERLGFRQDEAPSKKGVFV